MQANANLGVGAQGDASADAAAAAPAPAPAPAASGSYGGPVSDEEGDWKFGFNGYLHGAMRIGIGSRSNAAVQPIDAAGAAEVAAMSDVTFHPPIVPDDQYINWQHTNHSAREWTEMFFSYGNSWAKGTVSVQGYQFTDPNWSFPEAQLGIAQAWVEVSPYMPWENVRTTVKGGSFWSRYGMAGRWDAGEYDTYLFGRTHTMGEGVRLEVDSADSTFGFEQGFGTKQPDPSVYNRARFTLVHHEHVDWKTTVSSASSWELTSCIHLPNPRPR